MKLKRLSDRLLILNWATATIILGLGSFNIITHTFRSGDLIIAQFSLLAIQFFTVILGCKSYDKRSDFSNTISIMVHRCYTDNMIPTKEAIEEAKNQLRKEYARWFRTL